jgi:DsbC/DsbD-like thiol-disulfide interchange protein
MERRFLQTGLALALISACFALRSAWAGGKKSDAEVKVDVEAAKPEGGKQVITVKLDINKGWHIYGNPVGNETLEAAQTVVNVTGKNKPASVKVDYPKGHTVEDKVVGKYTSYEGKIEIRATVERAPGDTEPLTVGVRFQACDKNSCLFPATVKRTVP